MSTLQERLRNLWPYAGQYHRKTREEAADHIDALEAENEQLRKANKGFADRQEWWNERMFTLEAAAKAAGMDIEWQPGGWAHDNNTGRVWNPLTDDGDALRLAVKLHLWEAIRLAHREVSADVDIYAATRRAIVRAAAEIGRAK